MSEPTEIMLAIKQIAAERKIDVNEIIEAIKLALLLGFKNEYDLGEETSLKVEMDPEIGHIAVYANKAVVKKVKNSQIEISLEDAKEINSKAKIGDEIDVDITPSGNFGRIVAQSARQVILQKLRESEKESAIRELKDKIGTIESVRIQKILAEGDIVCEINRARALMPKAERVPTEFYKLGSSVKVLLKEIVEDTRGKYILVSRAAPEFLAELFRIEVPEIDSGTIDIMSIAREEGSRSKVAVRSNSDGVDAIGSCVGQKGVRINAIMNELSIGKFDEKVDIILWDEDIEHFIKNSVSPAEVISVKIKDKKNKKAVVVVPNDQYSLAIGREGQNARLASKLTGWEIDVQAENPEELETAEKVPAKNATDSGEESEDN